jgi:hypothetical protein
LLFETIQDFKKELLFEIRGLLQPKEWCSYNPKNDAGGMWFALAFAFETIQNFKHELAPCWNLWTPKEHDANGMWFAFVLFLNKSLAHHFVSHLILFGFEHLLIWIQ